MKKRLTRRFLAMLMAVLMITGTLSDAVLTVNAAESTALEAVEEIAASVLEDINPRDSWRASKALRQHIAVELTKRCLIKSIELAGGVL